MKAIVEGIEFEGTPEEFSLLIKEHAKNKNKTHSNSSIEPIYTQKDVVSKPSLVTTQEGYLPGAEDFVRSLYHYRPEHGGSSLALLIFTTGKQYTLRSVAQKAKCDTGQMHEIIQRSINAGCLIQIDNSRVRPHLLARARKISYSEDGQEVFVSVVPDSKVRYVSLGTVERAKEVALQMRQANKLQREKIVDNKSKYISTGSPPITKIAHS